MRDKLEPVSIPARNPHGGRSFPEDYADRSPGASGMDIARAGYEVPNRASPPSWPFYDKDRPGLARPATDMLDAREMGDDD